MLAQTINLDFISAKTLMFWGKESFSLKLLCFDLSLSMKLPKSRRKKPRGKEKFDDFDATHFGTPSKSVPNEIFM